MLSCNIIRIIVLVVIVCAPAVSVPVKPQSKTKNPEITNGLFEGDIKLPLQGRGVLLRGSNVRWPSGVVPYVIGTGYGSTEQATIISAMRRLENLTAVNSQQCVLFRPRVSTDPNYIRIENQTGCSSYVGRQTSVTTGQVVTLQNPGCIGVGTIMHEFTHALGFFHEQSRPDRDDFIQVNLENVETGLENNFNKYNTTATDIQNTPYDYGSVMHYGSLFFSKNGLPTIEPLQLGAVIGQRDDLSAVDIEEIRYAYNCYRTGTTTPVLTYYTVLSSSSAIFTRPSGSGNYFYTAYRVNAASSGTHTFRTNSGIDTFGLLYNVSFFPSTPNTNLLISDDDSAGNNQFQLTTALQSTVPVILVVTSYSTSTTGGVTVIVTGPGAVTFTPIYTTILSTSSATFTRPSGSGSYYYTAFRVNAAGSGTHTIESNSVIDTFGYLYNGAFFPSTPNTNLQISDDDSAGNNQFRLTTALQWGVPVILVVTTFPSSTTGTVTVTVSGPNAVTFVPLSIYTAVLSSSSSTFTRPSGSGTYYFVARQVNVGSSGTYTFESSGSVDAFGCLYSGSFSPSSPNTNLIITDDDSAGNNQFRFRAALQSTGTFILVVTTYPTSTTGSVTVTVTGPSVARFT